MFKHGLIPLLLTCTLVFASGAPAVADDTPPPQDASAQLVDAISGVDAPAPAAAVPLVPVTPTLTVVNPCPPGDHAFVDPAGVVSCSKLPPTGADLPNPATAPLQAWDDAKAARKVGWPLAVWAALAMLGKALAYGRDKLKTVPLVGKAAVWLSVGKRAMWVAAVGTVGSAGYDVLMSGGSVVAALIASGMAIAAVTHSTTKGAPQPVT